MYFIEMFLEQWFMEIMQLVVLGKILHAKMKYQRILLSAGIGSLLGCLILRFCSKYHTLMFFLIEPTMIITIMAAYQCSFQRAVKNSLYAWMIALTSGGIFMIIKQYFTKVWIIGAIVTIIFLWVFSKGLKKNFAKVQGGSYEVRFIWHEIEVSVCAFLDTGNFLYEPIHHLPVSILEEEAFLRYFHHSLEELISEYPIDKICLIPYRSIGKENGIMKGILVRNLKIIEEKQRIEVPCAVIAISKTQLSKWDHYEMLLHPDLIKNGRY